MAQGDVTIFNEAKAKMLDGDWASTDNFYLAICDNTTAPTAATVTPVIGDFTQVTAAGTYTTNGTDLGALSVLVSQTGGSAKFDSGTNPTWAKDASNATDAYWGIVYNFTDAGKDALCYVDLGGPVDMTAGDLTVNWHANGIITW